MPRLVEHKCASDSARKKRVRSHAGFPVAGDVTGVFQSPVWLKAAVARSDSMTIIAALRAMGNAFFS